MADRLWRRTRRKVGPRLDDELREGLAAAGAGVVHLDQPMGHWTTFGAGGVAEAVVEVTDAEGLGRLVRWCQHGKVPLKVIGRGCGTVVRRGGLHGVVAVTTAMGRVRRTDDPDTGDGGRVLADAGARPSDLASFAAVEGLGGLEPLAAVDGSIGGLLCRHWSQLRSMVVSVALVGPTGQVRLREVAGATRTGDLELAGRSAVAWVVLALPSAGTARQRVAQTTTVSPPVAHGRSVGRLSLFADPEGQRASEVLAGLDLHGIRLREVVIDPVDANVAINRGGGTTQDLLNLVEYLKKTAEKSCGVELRELFKVIGNKSP